MIVELDNSLLIKNNLTAKQYFILFLLYKETYHQLLKYLKLDPVDIEFFKTLKDNQWITGSNFNSITTLKVTKKFSSLIEPKDFFQELWDEFPVKVERPDGTVSYLRNAAKQCKTKYNRLIKNSRVKHESIIKSLRTEKAIRQKQNTLKYFKTLPNWLSAEEYVNYEGIDENDVNNSNNKQSLYGTNLL